MTDVRCHHCFSAYTMLSGPEKRGLLLQLLNVLGRTLPHLQSAQLAQPRGRLKLTPKKSPEPARCFPSMFLSTNFTYTQTAWISHAAPQA